MLLGGVLAALLSMTAPAAAHSELSASSPPDGAEVHTVPPSITLTFAEELQGSSTTVGVLVGDHDPVQVDVPVTGPTLTIDTSVAQLAQVAADGDGTWAVAYQVISGDGHPVDGTLTFTVTGSDDAAPTEGAPQADTATAAASAEQDEPMSPLLWLATVAVIGLVVFAVVKTDRMRRKKAEAAAKAAADKAAGRAPDD